MNDEPTWLRNDAAARARETEHENVIAEQKRRGAGRRQDPGLEAEASRALAAGQPEKLRPGAVLHLQRAAGNAGVARLLGDDREPESPVKEVVGKGSGQPLEAPVRQRMEASFGTDFSEVRVHSGGSAAASAQAMDAHAYTVGNEIVLGDGQTAGSPAHERTLAHELTHVVQQRSGPVDGTPAAGGIKLSDPADRYERAAETAADAVLSTGRAPDAAPSGAAAGGSVQRAAEPEEEEVQQLAIQREAVPEEDEQETDEDAGTVQELAIQRIQREEEEERLLL